MNKLAWLVVLTVLVAGGAYVFWPEPEVTAERFTDAAQPARFTVRCNGLEQRVDGTRVTIGGVELAADRGKVGALWNALSGIPVQPGRTVERIGEDQLAGYGLGGGRELSAEGVRLRWGATGGTDYAWNAAQKRVVVLPAGASAAIDAAAQRLDDRKLLPANLLADRLVVDGTVFVRNGGSWSAELHPERPSAARRINALLQLASTLALTDLAAPPVPALAPLAAKLSITGTAADGDPMEMGPDTKRRLVLVELALYRDLAGGGQVAVQGLPPQRLDPAAFLAWEGAVASLKQDLLLTVDELVPRSEITAFVVARDGAELFRLERREKPSGTDEHRWDLAWPGGRDDAAPDSFTRFLALLDNLRIREPRAEGLPKELPAGATVITIRWGRQGQSTRVALAGPQVWSERHRGRLADDPASVLDQLVPGRWLDRRLLRRDPGRVAKIQRVLHDETPRREEVVTRNESGAWLRTWPKQGAAQPVDAAAVERLVRQLAGAELGRMRFATAEDRAILADPQLEFDLRFASTTAGKQSIADTDVDDTADQDWGMALRREQDGKIWRGVDRDGQFGFTLDDEVVEALRQPFDPGAVFPVVPALVKRCEIRRGERLTVLVREGARWTVAEGGEPRPADEQAVRRWFRALGQLSAAARDDRAVEPPPAQLEGSVRCEVPGLEGGTELLALAVGRLGTLARVPVWTSSDKAVSRFPRGRSEIPAAAAEQVLPAAAAFAR